MKTSGVRSLWLAGIVVLLSASGLGAGQPRANGGDAKGVLGDHTPLVDFVLKHADDLGLTADQKAKLEALKEKIVKAREERKDPEGRELVKQIAEAKKAGDEAKLKELREKMRELIGKKAEQVREAIKEILTPDQAKKLHDLHAQEKGTEGRKGAKTDAKTAPTDL
jgi:Spy/CpxP family protein refolding chaperone